MRSTTKGSVGTGAGLGVPVAGALAGDAVLGAVFGAGLTDAAVGAAGAAETGGVTNGFCVGRGLPFETTFAGTPVPETPAAGWSAAQTNCPLQSTAMAAR